MLISLIFLKMLSLLFIPVSEIEIFPEIEGLEKSGDMEVYNQNNLFDYINGAADSYLNYDFVELKLQRYKGPADGSLKIEIYEHNSVPNAFGIYSTERPLNSNWVNIGEQAYYEEDFLNFYSGRYYVKIMTYKIKNSEAFLKEAASQIEEFLSKDDISIEIFHLFPEEGRKLNSERYINKNFMGYESLTEAFTVEYEIEDSEFDLFVIKKNDSSSVKKMLQKYFKSIDLNPADIVQGKILINDPFQGEYPVIWKDRYIFGTYNFNEIDTAYKYMQKMLSVLE